MSIRAILQQVRWGQNINLFKPFALLAIFERSFV